MRFALSALAGKIHVLTGKINFIRVLTICCLPVPIQSIGSKLSSAGSSNYDIILQMHQTTFLVKITVIRSQINRIILRVIITYHFF